jgi:hypothetical protein
LPLNTVTTGNTILAQDLNQVINVLQRAAGQTEVGKYFLRGSAYAVNANMGNYMPTHSQGATPVSVSVDEADQGHLAGNANPAATGNLTQYGFLVYSSGSVVGTLWTVGGNWTVQY